MKLSFNGEDTNFKGKVEFITEQPWGMSVLKYKPLCFGFVWMTKGYPEYVGKKLLWRLCYYKPNPDCKDWVKVIPNEQ